MLRPIITGQKRIGQLKVAPRVQGKIMETDAGTRYMIVEQKGRDIWRGRQRSLHDAIETGDAAIGVDKVLLTRCALYGVTTIMVAIEELRRIYLLPVATFGNEDLGRSRPNYQGRSTRIIPYTSWHQKYLGPAMKAKRRRAA